MLFVIYVMLLLRQDVNRMMNDIYDERLEHQYNSRLVYYAEEEQYIITDMDKQVTYDAERKNACSTTNGPHSIGPITHTISKDQAEQHHDTHLVEGCKA